MTGNNKSIIASTSNYSLGTKPKAKLLADGPANTSASYEDRAPRDSNGCPQDGPEGFIADVELEESIYSLSQLIVELYENGERSVAQSFVAVRDTLVKLRSPEQVARMEAARGIA